METNNEQTNVIVKPFLDYINGTDNPSPLILQFKTMHTTEEAKTEQFLVTVKAIPSDILLEHNREEEPIIAPGGTIMGRCITSENYKLKFEYTLIVDKTLTINVIEEEKKNE